VLFFHVDCCVLKAGEVWGTSVAGPTSITELGYGTERAKVLLDHFKCRHLLPNLWELRAMA